MMEDRKKSLVSGGKQGYRVGPTILDDQGDLVCYRPGHLELAEKACV